MNVIKTQEHSVGFTIVELLVVIVVIGILAAITIVSYSGIAGRALIANLQSDLVSDSKQLKLYNVEHGYYPSSLDEDNCPLTPDEDARYCLKSSSGVELTYVGGAQIFKLTATKNGISYRVTEDRTPFSVTPIPITAIGAITGTPQMMQTLTAGAITPADATVAYQWQSAATSGGIYTNIAGATNDTYTLPLSMVKKYIRVVAIGSGEYIGTQTSAATSSAIAVDANWVVVGTQVWAKANLNIGTMVDVASNQTNNSVIEKHCHYNDTSYCTANGGLYEWDEAMQYVVTESARGICPVDSHIPSDTDWNALVAFFGSTTDAGVQLKSGGSSGLNIPFGGYVNVSGTSSFISQEGFLWTSTASGTSATYRRLLSSGTDFRSATILKPAGMSVRCIAN